LLVCIHGGGCDGRYFALPGFSVADLAVSQGHDVLLVDRPGHGSSAANRTATPIVEAAELLPDLVEPLLRNQAPGGLLVLGHSIGGAVALTLAAGGRLPIDAVAVSGIGRTPSRSALSWYSRFRIDGLPPPTDFFFGPKGSYDWRAPIALRKITKPWRIDEVRETLIEWPKRFDAIAAALAMPVSIHLAEHERIWEHEEVATGSLALKFTNAPRVVSGILPTGGHLNEIHVGGAEMVRRQIAFLSAGRARE
jgi:pimeloyl-ACP methyl ester carboxylesterase